MINMEIHSMNFSKSLIKIAPLSSLEIKLKEILKGRALTRDQMVTILDIPRTTIYDGLKKLIVRGLVIKYPEFKPERSKGRPKILFALKDN